MAIDVKRESPYLAQSREDLPELTQNARVVLEKRYLRRNAQGEIIETPEEMFKRVANALATAELKYNPDADVETVAEDYYQVMAGLLFLPNSPALLNAGTGRGQLAGSMVLPVEDSLSSIFDSVKTAVAVHQGGSGIGFNFSKIRPKEASVCNHNEVAFGPVALIDILSKATVHIRQGGIRRGCNSVLLDANHPDILEFIRAKSNQSILSNFYTCVAISDEFMSRVRNGENYSLVDPRTGETAGWLSAQGVFDQIVDQAWRTGDPGLVFVDRINRDNPTPQLGRLEHVSGCGEQPLLPHEFCHLGSINLSRILRSDGGRLVVDFEKLSRVITIAVRLLDDAIDITQYPTPETEIATKRTRKIGLGVMGFADMLFQLRIPYDSEAAIEIARQVMSFIQSEAHAASQELALERGPFPVFMTSTLDSCRIRPTRNATCTTIAPTGTISLIAGCTSGIEPAFATVFVRNAFKGEHLLLDVNSHFEVAARNAGVFTSDLLERLVSHNSLCDQPEIPSDLKRVFVTAHEIKPEWHVRMQAAFQELTDSAVSKTVNLPASATREELLNIFIQAYDSGLKGITVYRDHSRSGQPFCTGDVGVELVRTYVNK